MVVGSETAAPLPFCELDVLEVDCSARAEVDEERVQCQGVGDVELVVVQNTAGFGVDLLAYG